MFVPLKATDGQNQNTVTCISRNQHQTSSVDQSGSVSQSPVLWSTRDTCRLLSSSILSHSLVCAGPDRTGLNWIGLDSTRLIWSGLD